MSTKRSSIPLLSISDQIEAYQLGELNEKYDNWTQDKIPLMKNAIIKTVYTALKIIPKSSIGCLRDGKNASFCLIHKKKGNFTQEWRQWWFEFSKFKDSDYPGRQFGSSSLSDFNQLMIGIKAGWLIVKPLDWKGIEKYLDEGIAMRSQLPLATTEDEVIVSTSSMKKSTSKRGRADTVSAGDEIKRLRTESQHSQLQLNPDSATFLLPELQIEDVGDPDSLSDIEIQQPQAGHIDDELHFQKSAEMPVSRLDYPNKAPTPGYCDSTTSFNQAPPSVNYITHNFSLFQFAEGECKHPLDPTKNWSLPDPLPENLDPDTESSGKEIQMLQDVIQSQRALAAYQRDLEFSIYLIMNGLKVVPEDSLVAGSDDIVMSKDKYEELKQDLIGMGKALRELLAEKEELMEALKRVKEEEKLKAEEQEKQKEKMLDLNRRLRERLEKM
ncbi:hypothetical protein HOY82DRAFT_540593 [Tuber indicum]|nr:hypothetical protein HOY82DRAFT_540593 [Tuber indicum]